MKQKFADSKTLYNTLRREIVSDIDDADTKDLSGLGKFIRRNVVLNMYECIAVNDVFEFIVLDGMTFVYPPRSIENTHSQ